MVRLSQNSFACWDDLGLIDYKASIAVQKNTVGLRRAGLITDTLLLLEHPPVYTVGRAPGAYNQLLVSSQRLLEQGIEVVSANRGGGITYHGPGQLVGYLVFGLDKYNNDVLHFIRLIESLLIITLENFGLNTGRDMINSGVWVGKRKIAAIGLGLRGGITFHGFALNVNTDLARFESIIACGLKDRQAISIEALTSGPCPDLSEIKRSILFNFPRVFKQDIVQCEKHTGRGEKNAKQHAFLGQIEST